MRARAVRGRRGPDVWGPSISGRMRDRRYLFGFDSGWAMG
jgi:hypothetical protein